MSPDLLPLEEAVQCVIRHARRLRPEPAQLRECLGRILSEPVRAPFDVPREAASLMDGYAVRAAETARDLTLSVAFEVRAGTAARRALASGECARILTGAPLPSGADAVVKQEDVQRTGDRVTLRTAVPVGEHVRQAGSDARTGDVLLEAGTEIDAGALSLLASVGDTTFAVEQRPVVAILATGDELRAPGEPLDPGTIYETNTWGLVAQVQGAGGLAGVLGRAPDDPAAIAATLASTRADIYVTSGGASVGDYDFSRQVLERLDGRKVFWQVAIRPGRPILFGVIDGRAPSLFFALPGNPAASALTFDLFVRTAIRVMTGAAPVRRPRVKAILESPVKKPEGLTQLVRGALVAHPTGRLLFRAASLQGSMSIASLHGLGAVAIASGPGSKVEAGSLVDVEPWGPVLPA